MLNPNNFYTVFYWMISELHLKGAELPVFAIIYSFSQDGQSCFSGSLKYIAEFTGTSRRNVTRVINKLIEKSFVIRKTQIVDDKRFISYEVNSEVLTNCPMGMTNCQGGIDKMSMGGMTNCPMGIDKMSTNNKDIVNIDNEDDIYMSVLQSFNSICKTLPQIRALSDTRKTHIKTFIEIIGKYDLSIDDYFNMVEASEFLTGRDGKWLNCSFDWLIKKSNAIKVCEGNYNREKPDTSTVRY